MALDKNKTKNIITFSVVGVAVVLAVIVILIKFGVIGPRTHETTTESTSEIETFVTVIYETSVDDEGNVFEYSVTDYYTRPSVSSNHRYPTTTKKTTATETTTKVDYFVEITSVEAETDENGEPVTNEEGEAVTKVVTITVPSDEHGSTTGTSAPTTTETTSETTTKILYYTDPISKRPIKNIRGEYMISEIQTESGATKESTTKSTPTKPSTTKSPSTTDSNTGTSDTSSTTAVSTGTTTAKSGGE